MQARGDNLFSLMKAFANSSNLLTAQERESLGDSASQSKEERPIFFDYFARFLVCYNLFQGVSWLFVKKMRISIATKIEVICCALFLMNESYAGLVLEKASPGIPHDSSCYVPAHAPFITLTNWEFIHVYQFLL